MKTTILVAIGAIGASIVTGAIMSNTTAQPVPTPVQIVHIDATVSSIPIPTIIPSPTDVPIPSVHPSAGKSYADPSDPVKLIVVGPTMAISPTGYHS